MSYEQSTPYPMPERIIAVVNPVSANADRGKAMLTAIELRHKVPVTTIETTAEGRTANQDRLLDTLADLCPDKSTMVATVGGDGTVNDVMSALLAHEQFRELPFMPLPGGNGNNGAHNAHGKWGSRRPVGLLSRSTLQPTPVLHTKVDGETGALDRLSLSYVGFGVSARIAQVVDGNRGNGSRRQQLVAEKVLGLRSVREANAAPFTVVDDTAGHQLIERSFVNGHDMAKGLLFPNNDIAEGRFRQVDIAPLRNCTTALAWHAGRFVLGLGGGEDIPSEVTRQFTIVEPTLAQFDGEAVQLGANSAVAVGHSSHLLNLVRLDLPYK